jgi:hypothetical protein
LFLSQLLNGALLMQTQSVGGIGAGDKYEMVTDLATDILTKVPKPFDVKAFAEQYPVLYTDSLNTVLRQVSYQMAYCIVTLMQTRHPLSYSSWCSANVPQAHLCFAQSFEFATVLTQTCFVRRVL